MRVVLDTDILPSALISPHGAPDAIYGAWRRARFDLVTSEIELDELRRASRHPEFGEVLQPHRVGEMVNDLQRSLVLDPLSTPPAELRSNDSFGALAAAHRGLDADGRHGVAGSA